MEADDAKTVRQPQPCETVELAKFFYVTGLACGAGRVTPRPAFFRPSRCRSASLSGPAKQPPSRIVYGRGTSIAGFLLLADQLHRAAVVLGRLAARPGDPAELDVV